MKIITVYEFFIIFFSFQNALKTLVSWYFSGKKTEWLAISFPEVLRNPGIKPESPVSPS